MTARFVTVFVCFMVTIPSATGQDWIVTPDDGDAVAKIQAALDEATNVDFIEVPLQEIVDFLSDFHGIPIVMDVRALDAIGHGPDTPLTRRLEGITLRSTLRLLLEEIQLTYLIRDEVLFITSQDAAQRKTEVRVYKIADLLDGNESAGELLDTLVSALGTAEGGPSYGYGSAETAGANKASPQLSVYQDLLIVRDTFHGHAEVARLLSLLKRGIVEVEPPPK